MQNLQSWAIRNKGIYREWLVVRVPFQVKQQLEQKAKARGLSISDLVRLYIEKAFKEEEENGKE
jgi:post-segregation antitoxin (ccd killing protein)